MLARAEDSVLVVVDMQSTFLAPIHESERVMARAKFLVRAAGLLGIPVLSTVQYPERMGGTDPALDGHHTILDPGSETPRMEAWTDS